MNHKIVRFFTIDWFRSKDALVFLLTVIEYWYFSPLLTLFLNTRKPDTHQYYRCMLSSVTIHTNTSKNQPMYTFLHLPFLVKRFEFTKPLHGSFLDQTFNILWLASSPQSCPGSLPTIPGILQPNLRLPSPWLHHPFPDPVTLCTDHTLSEPKPGAFYWGKMSFQLRRHDTAVIAGCKAGEW